MSSRLRTIATKYVNVGTPLVLMGALWLYLLKQKVKKGPEPAAREAI